MNVPKVTGELALISSPSKKMDQLTLTQKL